MIQTSYKECGTNFFNTFGKAAEKEELHKLFI